MIFNLSVITFPHFTFDMWAHHWDMQCGRTAAMYCGLKKKVRFINLDLKPGFTFTALCLWARHLMSLTLSFLIYKVGIMIIVMVVTYKHPACKHCRISLYCASLYCASQILRFLQIEGVWHPSSSKSIGVIFPKVFATSCFCVTFW